DPALIQEACGLDPPELRDRHQDVEHLRGLHVLRRIAQDLVDLHRPRFEVLLELRPADADVVRPLERLHALVERAEWCLSLSLERWHERRILTSGRRPSTCMKLPNLQGVFYAANDVFTGCGAARTASSACAAAKMLSGPSTPLASSSCSNSARIRAGAAGSVNRTVPRATSAAPAATNSSTSLPLPTPPAPTIGRRVAS